MFNMYAPSALLLVLGAMTFLLPPLSGEKTGMSITVLLAVSVYMFILTEHTPETSRELPLLGRY